MTFGLLGFGKSIGGWTQLKVGAGGLITGISTASDGTVYCRTDTMGAYKWDGTSKWNQVCTTSSLGSDPIAAGSSVQTGTASGVYEIQPAPSNSNVVYMAYGAFNAAGSCKMFVSTDACANWKTTSFVGGMDSTGNHGAARKYGPHGAVDPINPDVFYIATNDQGVFRTLDGTTNSTFTQISTSSLPLNDSQYMGCVAFDSSGGTTSGKTNNIYVSVSGSGLYKSTNAGNTWALVANMPATTSVKRIKVASDGVVYLLTYTSTSSPENSCVFYKLTFPAGVPTWTNITNGFSQPEGFVLDLTTSGVNQKIAMFNYLGAPGFQYSTNAGSSWTSPLIWGTAPSGTYTLALGSQNFNISPGQNGVVKVGQGVFIADGSAVGTPPGTGTAKSWGRGTVTAYDNTSGVITINWVAVNGVLGPYSDFYLRNGGFAIPSAPNMPWLLEIGPVQGPFGNIVGMLDVALEPISGKLFGCGIQSPVQLAWPPVMDGTWAATNLANGVEEMSCKMMVVPPGGKPIAATEDVGFLKVQSTGQAPPHITYPGGTAAGSFNNFLVDGWGLDWSASSPNFLAGVISSRNIGNNLAKTTNGGDSWTLSAAVPSDIAYIKNVAVSDANNWVVQPNNATGQRPAYTLDGGATWTNLGTLGGQTPGGGWGQAQLSPGNQICADKASPNTFYMYNDGAVVGGARGIYKSTNGGVSWTFTPKNLGAGYIWLKAAPMVAGGINTTGHIFSSLINYSGGNWSGPEPTFLFNRSTDGGVTWQPVRPPTGPYPWICEVWAYGFGKNAPGQTYPAVIINGFYKADANTPWVRGTYRSLDNCVTFQKIGEAYPDGWPDTITDIAGDLDTFGTYYVTKGGSNFIIGKVDAPPLQPLGPLITLASTRNDNTPNFTVDYPYGNPTGDVLPGDILQIQKTFAGVKSDYVIHTVTQAEILGAPLSLSGISPLADGVWNFDARLVRISGPSSDWSPSVPVNIDTTAPTITSTAASSINENDLLDFVLSASETVTWSIIGGADQSKFEIFNGNHLRWAGNTTRSFATPVDANGDNIYDVQIRATDLAANTTDQNISVTVLYVVKVVGFTKTYASTDVGHTGGAGDYIGPYGADLSAVPIGSPGGRSLVLAVMCVDASSGGVQTPTVTFNNTNATFLTNNGTTVTNGADVVMGYAVVPTGTTMALKIDLKGYANWTSLTVYALNNLTNTTPFDTKTYTSAYPAPDPQGLTTLNIPTGGFGIAAFALANKIGTPVAVAPSVLSSYLESADTTTYNSWILTNTTAGSPQPMLANGVSGYNTTYGLGISFK
jgi:hypothetical protein